MSGRSLKDRRAARSAAIGAVMALLALPDAAFAQADAAKGGPPSMLNRAGKPPQPTSSRRPVDLLDLRDRIDGVETTAQVAPAAVGLGSILCVAGCDGKTTTIAQAAPAKLTPFLAVMGPLEAATIQPTQVTTAAPVSVPAPVAYPVTPPASAPAVSVPSDNLTNVVVCLAGCYDNDRRTMAATGAPLPYPELPVRNLMAAAPSATATKLAVAPAVTLAVRAAAAKPLVATAPIAGPVTLKRTLTAHAVRAKARSKIAARQRRIVEKAQPKQVIAAIGVPAPVPPAAPAQPKAPVVKAHAVVVQKKPVVVNTTNDWFNKINREQAAKKPAEPAKDD